MEVLEWICTLSFRDSVSESTLVVIEYLTFLKIIHYSNFDTMINRQF